MIFPKNLIGWHGFSEGKIIYQNGEDIIIDMSNWVNKNQEGEWKEGIMIKKEFTSHILIVINPKWKENHWECDDIIIGKGKINGNKFYARLFSKNIFLMKEVSIAFPHKVKQIPDKRYSSNVFTMTPEDYEDEELLALVKNIKCN